MENKFLKKSSELINFSKCDQRQAPLMGERLIHRASLIFSKKKLKIWFKYIDKFECYKNKVEVWMVL